MFDEFDKYDNNTSIFSRIYGEEIYFFQTIIYSHMEFKNTIKSLQEKLELFLTQAKLNSEQSIIEIYLNEDCDITANLEGKRKITSEELEKYSMKSNPFLFE